jgi:hypothetical protein
MMKLLTYSFPLSIWWLIVPYCFSVSLLSCILSFVTNISIFPLTSGLFNSHLFGHWLASLLAAFLFLFLFLFLDIIILIYSALLNFPLFVLYVAILLWLGRMLRKAWREIESYNNEILKLCLLLFVCSISSTAGFVAFSFAKKLLLFEELKTN